jgi:hypothetical protein
MEKNKVVGLVLWSVPYVINCEPYVICTL